MAHPYKGQARTGKQRARSRYAEGGSVDTGSLRFIPEASFAKQADNPYQTYKAEGRIPLTSHTDFTTSGRLTPNEVGPGRHGYEGRVGISHRFNGGGKVK